MVGGLWHHRGMADNDTQKDAQAQDTQDQGEQDQGEQKKDADNTSQASQGEVKKAPARKAPARKKASKSVKVTGLASTTYMKKGDTAVVEDTDTIQKLAQKGWVKVEDHDG